MNVGRHADEMINDAFDKEKIRDTGEDQWTLAEAELSADVIAIPTAKFLPVALLSHPAIVQGIR